MRLFNSLLIGMTAFLVAGSAAATVTINNSSAANGTSIALDSTITVAVNLKWDGQGQLQGVFTSTGYDASVLQFVSASTAPASILGFADPDTGDVIPGLNRLLAPSIVGGFLRTVQYAVGSADAVVDPRAANAGGAGRQITILTFKAIGAGTTNIAAILGGAADTGAVGDTFASGTSVTVTVVPEPGTALLMGLGLAGLGVAGRRRA